ncbi:EF-hand domain-containing protein [Actinosynnema pretiosum subsp. pretiosum]|nr:EF-hand domain-containing protein [Actinosynnema mirum]AXX32191.1 putative calcium binding protein [Actinosynnema pretiosum subsp. pretiosum]QUF03852.1 EF-hand domain-containing protein [Actinosynnema pretiosum subsp. pretiosum]
MRTEVKPMALARAELIFSLFDADASGELEMTDFDLMADRVDAAASGSEMSDRHAMRAALASWWEVLADHLDVDRDGRITLDEFCGCVLSPERFEGAVEVFARALAVLGDPDGDGMIERPRFHALMTAFGFSPDNIDALFDAFEPTDDDEVEVRTWESAIKDYYRPDKAGIAGDHLVPAQSRR